MHRKTIITRKTDIVYFLGSRVNRERQKNNEVIPTIAATNPPREPFRNSVNTNDAIIALNITLLKSELLDNKKANTITIAMAVFRPKTFTPP